MIITKQQKGLSLIELMVTLAISSLLMIGITQLYLDNKRNHAFLYNQSSNLDNTRYFSLTLDAIINKAGYRRAAHQGLEGAFKPQAANSDCAAFASGAVFTPLASSPQTGFCIRYEPAFSGEYDCQGNTSSLPAEKNKAFLSISSDEQIIIAIKYDPETYSLKCKSINNKNSQYVQLIGGISDEQKEKEERKNLVETSGIVDIKFSFGSSKKEHQVDQYTTADSWDRETHGDIRTVQYEALIRSRGNQREGESNILAQWLEKADTASKTRLRTEDNRNLYQVSSNAPIARNLMP